MVGNEVLKFKLVSSMGQGFQPLIFICVSIGGGLVLLFGLILFSLFSCFDKPELGFEIIMSSRLLGLTFKINLCKVGIDLETSLIRVLRHM